MTALDDEFEQWWDTLKLTQPILDDESLYYCVKSAAKLAFSKGRQNTTTKKRQDMIFKRTSNVEAVLHAAQIQCQQLHTLEGDLRPFGEPFLLQITQNLRRPVPRLAGRVPIVFASDSSQYGYRLVHEFGNVWRIENLGGLQLLVEVEVHDGE